MSTLLSQGGYGCVYYPGIKCTGEVDSDKKYVTKLQLRDFNANNEVIIGSLVSKIKNYEKFFIPIIKNCDIDVRRLNDRVIRNCDVVRMSNSLDFMLMKLDYVKNVSLEKSIVSSNSMQIKRRSFAKLINMYKYLMNSISLLLQKNIVHFDLKPDNLLFGENTGTPLIIDFGISIPINSLKKDNFSRYFYAYSPEYYVWPLEVHTLNYLLHKTSETLNESDITIIANDCCRSNSALLFFSESIRKRYLLSCIYQLKKYVGKDRQSIISDIMSYYHTWDCYSIGIMFINLFSKIFKEGFHFNKLIVYFTQLLLINISPDPKLRYTPQDNIEEYNNCRYIEGNVQNLINLLSDLR